MSGDAIYRLFTYRLATQKITKYQRIIKEESYVRWDEDEESPDCVSRRYMSDDLDAG
jgi:hypothetical protein